VDFGIADVVASGGAIQAGTLPYMAPEQARGLSDPRSDIYSLGAVLREMVGDGAPTPVQNVIDSCLREEPEERWQSAADLARALEWLVAPVRASAPVPWWRRWWTGYAAAGLVVAAAALWWTINSRERPHPPVLVPLRGPNNYQIR
jgi:serine/threonine protein kinase